MGKVCVRCKRELPMSYYQKPSGIICKQCRWCREDGRERKRRCMAKKNRKSTLDETLNKLKKYNEKYGLNLTYGQYQTLKQTGRLKVGE